MDAVIEAFFISEDGSRLRVVTETCGGGAIATVVAATVRIMPNHVFVLPWKGNVE